MQCPIANIFASKLRWKNSHLGNKVIFDLLRQLVPFDVLRHIWVMHDWLYHTVAWATLLALLMLISSKYNNIPYSLKWMQLVIASVSCEESHYSNKIKNHSCQREYPVSWEINISTIVILFISLVIVKALHCLTLLFQVGLL